MHITKSYPTKSYSTKTLLAICAFTVTSIPPQMVGAQTSQPTDADRSTICFDVDLTGTVSFKVDHKKPKKITAPVRPDLADEQSSSDPEAIKLTNITSRDDLYTALRALNDDWSTPRDAWSTDAVRVTVLENRDVACRIVYTKNRLFAQPKSLEGFIVQPISAIQFRQLNKAIFGKATI